MGMLLGFTSLRTERVSNVCAFKGSKRARIGPSLQMGIPKPGSGRTKRAVFAWSLASGCRA